MATVLYAVIEPTPDQMHVCLAGNFPVDELLAIEARWCLSTCSWSRTTPQTCL
jgi:hypothetical protein